MSWDIVKEATDLLLTKSIIQDLDVRLSQKRTFMPNSSWLSSSSYAINTIRKNVVGRKVKNNLLRSVYYLRCLYYWKKEDTASLENELVNYIFEEFPEEPIFNFIQGSIYLHKMLPLLKSGRKNKTEITDCLNSAFIFFNKAYNTTNEFEIKVAINMSLAWMYHLTGREDKFNKSILKAKSEDNKKMGKGWTLWINWIGRELSDKEIIFLTEKL